jgi:hypothetical protein
MSTSYTLGVDLGQARSYTAIVLLAHETVDHPTYDAIHLQRFPLGTAYPEIVDRIVTPLETAPLRGNTIVAVDAGSVGAPVLDLLRPRLPRGIRLRPIEITGGKEVNTVNGKTTVPKSAIIATTQILFQNHRIRIAASCPAAPDLAEELRSYTITINDNGHPTYRAAHNDGNDDPILALGLAAWTAENTSRGNVFTTYVPRGIIPTLNADTRAAMGYGPLDDRDF